MSSTILALHAIRFPTRIALGGCLINFEGETYACEVEQDSANPTSPTFIVKDKETRKELCTFRPWNVWWLSETAFQIDGAAYKRRSSATLIVPTHGIVGADHEEDTEEHL